MKQRDNDIFLLWLLPMALVLLCFVILPLLVTVVDSLYSVSLLNVSDRSFAGADNYLTVLKDANVRTAAGNTLFYTVVSLTAETVLGIAAAVALKEKYRGRSVILAVLSIPWALPPMVNSMTWKLIFDPSVGILNEILLQWGVIDAYQVWLNNPELSKWCVTTVHVWKMLPFIVIIMLARLQTMPREIMEAAETDGASAVQKFRYFTFPYLRPVLFITLAQGTIGSVHLFDEPYAMTGTALDTRTLLIQDYLTAFREYNLGTGMALALLISVSILLLMVLYAKLAGRQEEW